MFLSQVDQSKVDNSTEKWLDKVEDNIKDKYKAWFCGHWHTDKQIDKMHFLYETWECIQNRSDLLKFEVFDLSLSLNGSLTF